MIKRLKINNIAGRNIDWELDRINILGGANNTGKTQILKKINYLVENDCYFDETEKEDDYYLEFVDASSIVLSEYISTQNVPLSWILKNVYSAKPNYTVLDLLVSDELHKFVINEDSIDFLNQCLKPFMLNVIGTVSQDYQYESFWLINEKNGQQMRISASSSGVKELLYVLLRVINSRKFKTVYLLDCVDINMHVDWCKILITEILNINPKAQIIAATHMPSLINFSFIDNVKEINEITV